MLDVPQQITIDDAALECERQQRLAASCDLERLGGSFEYGWVILELLVQVGWYVHVTTPFAGQVDGDGTRGVMVVARHPLLDGVDLRVTGRTVADCATPLMIEAGKYIRKIANAHARASTA